MKIYPKQKSNTSSYDYHKGSNKKHSIVFLSTYKRLNYGIAS